MMRFIKILIVFVYLILGLFVQPEEVFACDFIRQNSSAQYYISITKSENHFVNNKKEEDYVVLKSNNRTEISNISNKNQNSGLGSFNKTNADFIIPDNYIINNSIYPCISHNISPNLKNAIYTRAP